MTEIENKADVSGSTMPTNKSEKHVEWREESIEHMKHFDEEEQLDPDAQSIVSGITWYMNSIFIRTSTSIHNKLRL